VAFERLARLHLPERSEEGARHLVAQLDVLNTEVRDRAVGLDVSRQDGETVFRDQRSKVDASELAP
jgi:hypothetical protein